MMKKIFRKILLLVTRHGFTVMTLKPNNNPHIGRVLLHPTPRKHNRCAREWKQCCLFFFRPSRHRALWITPKGQTIIIFTWQFWDVCGIWYEESHLKCGLQESRSSITIMNLLTQCSQLNNSSQNIRFIPFHNPSIHLTSPCSTFFF
jgi:hypothetical protein